MGVESMWTESTTCAKILGHEGQCSFQKPLGKMGTRMGGFVSEDGGIPSPSWVICEDEKAGPSIG